MLSIFSLALWSLPLLTYSLSQANSKLTCRKNFVFGAGVGVTSLIFSPGNAVAKFTAGPEAFVGTYSDPINHPGGKRTIQLLEGKVGDYQLGQVVGGGGIGEPENYVLPACFIGDRMIVIDFTPKGGPRDFVGVLDGNDIKFLKDGNRWPRL